MDNSSDYVVELAFLRANAQRTVDLSKAIQEERDFVDPEIVQAIICSSSLTLQCAYDLRGYCCNDSGEVENYADSLERGADEVRKGWAAHLKLNKPGRNK